MVGFRWLPRPLLASQDMQPALACGSNGARPGPGERPSVSVSGLTKAPFNPPSIRWNRYGLMALSRVVALEISKVLWGNWVPVKDCPRCYANGIERSVPRCIIAPRRSVEGRRRQDRGRAARATATRRRSKTPRRHSGPSMRHGKAAPAYPRLPLRAFPDQGTRTERRWRSYLLPALIHPI
jgi:hypothetical protein